MSDPRGFIPDPPGFTPDAAPPPQPATPQASAPSIPEIAGRGFVQGSTAGFGDELKGLAQTLGLDPAIVHGAIAMFPPLLPVLAAHAAITGGKKLASKGLSGVVDEYAGHRNEDRAANEAAQKAGPKLYGGSAVVGSLPLAAVGGAPATVGDMAATGGVLGAVAGLGSSKADLTKGEVAPAIGDAAVGGTTGALLGAAAKPAAAAAKGVGSLASGALESLGTSRLFKAAVGQNKGAFVKMNGKGLLDKAGQYLDKMGIGFGDSTESIGSKLTARRDALIGALDETVSSLDAASGGKVTVDPSVVADQIEKKVAEPLKKLAAARGDYQQVMSEVQAIRDIGHEIPFAEAAKQRAAMQKQVNYDAKSGRDITAQARREMARIWNDVIDQKAEGLLKASGKPGDAYRELRHETAMVDDLLGHVTSRIAGNAANKWASPSDLAMGATAGLMSGHPLLAVAAFVANHLARVYGNAAAGRTALGMARLASTSSLAAEKILPPVFRAATVARPSSAPMLEAAMAGRAPQKEGQQP